MGPYRMGKCYILWREKLNLDGPDGFNASWKDTRLEPELLSRIQQGGGSVIVWVAISYKGTIDFVRADGNINSEYYCNIISEELLTELNRLYPDGWVFMQDNGRCKTSNYTKQWLEANDIDILVWPPKSQKFGLEPHR